MTDKLNESLSALMDDETDQLELRRLLKEMAEMEEMKEMAEIKAKWHRYHVISAACKQEIHSSPSCNLLPGIQAELENDEIPAAEIHSPVEVSTGVAGVRRKGFLQVLGQGAIAASVALAVLFTADLVMDNDSTGASVQSPEFAGSDASTNAMPGLTGELNPSTPTRVAVQTELDAEEMSRLERVVSEELDESLERREIPATFVP